MTFPQPPAAGKCGFALRNAFSRATRFARKSWILVKKRNSTKKVVPGSKYTNLEWEFILFRGFCGFVSFRHAKITGFMNFRGFYGNSVEFLHFHGILWIFTWFREKHPSDFATPLMLFGSPFEKWVVLQKVGALDRKITILMTFHLHFGEMGWKLVLLGKSGAPAGRVPKTSTKPIGFLGILRCQSLIFGEFHVK